MLGALGPDVVLADFLSDCPAYFLGKRIQGVFCQLGRVRLRRCDFDCGRVGTGHGALRGEKNVHDQKKNSKKAKRGVTPIHETDIQSQAMTIGAEAGRAGGVLSQPGISSSRSCSGCAATAVMAHSTRRGAWRLRPEFLIGLYIGKSGVTSGFEHRLREAEATSQGRHAPCHSISGQQSQPAECPEVSRYVGRISLAASNADICGADMQSANRRRFVIFSADKGRQS